MNLFRYVERSWRKLAVSMLICSLSVAGCIHSPTYPEHWAPLNEIKPTESLPFLECKIFKGCWCGAASNEYFTGSYQDKGEMVPKQKDSRAVVSLTHLISKNKPDNINTIEYVTIRGPQNGMMEISAWNQDKLIVTNQLRELKGWEGGNIGITPDSFSCASKSGKILLNYIYSGDMIYGAMGGASKYLFLYKAMDGALIGEYINSGAGLILVVPFFYSDRQWYRFAPIR